VVLIVTAFIAVASLVVWEILFIAHMVALYCVPYSKKPTHAYQVLDEENKSDPVTVVVIV
jgi:hypothetical protein